MKKSIIANIAPDEMQCVGCDHIKPADEIDWEIFGETGVIACIDCADDMDELIIERG